MIFGFPWPTMDAGGRYGFFNFRGFFLLSEAFGDAGGLWGIFNFRGFLASTVTYSS